MQGIEDFNKERVRLNALMTEHDSFFKEFGALDDRVYSDGAIPKKYKELMGLVVSLLSKCDECILYHLQGCAREGVSSKEIIESIKIAVIGGGSVIYPSARLAFKTMEKFNLI